jgi:hypothetical protein
VKRMDQRVRKSLRSKDGLVFYPAHNPKVVSSECDPRNRSPHSHAASEKLNSVVRVVQTGPPALFAFPLPSLAHTSWQNRWFNSGPRNQKIPSFQHFPRTPQPSELTILRLAEESTSLGVFAYPLKLY